jgi:murein L,D-transpeptidase YafK|uniref:L,D-TPase catalytic domain-containing protein n=1 Tax=Desulfobacca acetoxidans TaxID=60893 RepID=A0A7V6A3Q1_9BACT
MRNWLVFFVFLALAWGLTGCRGKQQVTTKPPVPQIEEEQRQLTAEQQEIKQLLEKNGYSSASTHGPKPTVLLVKKSDRRLTVYRGLTPLKTYPIVLGGNPMADKLCQGDMCTPEGVYHVVCKYNHPRWDKFILLDYPNTQNWLKFTRAKIKGQLPEFAQIGGDIGIHGTADPSKNLNREDWTLGCVSLLNQHIEEIYPMVNDDTLVVIKKR